MSSLQDLINARWEAQEALWQAQEELRDLFLYYRRRKVLDAREYKILKMRWFERKTLEKVGHEFDVTRDRVRELERKSLNKIKRAEKRGL